MAAVIQKSDLSGEFGFLPRIAQADKAAAQECIDYYGALLWTLAKQSTKSDETAEKALQEIFLDIWDNAAFCDLTVSEEENWIVLIARRRLAKYLTAAVRQSQTTSAIQIP